MKLFMVGCFVLLSQVVVAPPRPRPICAPVPQKMENDSPVDRLELNRIYSERWAQSKESKQMDRELKKKQRMQDDKNLAKACVAYSLICVFCTSLSLSAQYYNGKSR